MRHGALIVLGGAVQSVGFNKNVLDPYYHKDAPKLSIHAEEMALMRATRTKGAVLYVARINNAGLPRMSKPCSKCAALMLEAGIKRCIYTVNNVMEFK